MFIDIDIVEPHAVGQIFGEVVFPAGRHLAPSLIFGWVNQKSLQRVGFVQCPGLPGTLFQFARRDGAHHVDVDIGNLHRLFVLRVHHGSSAGLGVVVDDIGGKTVVLEGADNLLPVAQGGIAPAVDHPAPAAIPTAAFCKMELRVG